MIEASNLSNQEYYRLNGCLNPQRTEALLDKPEVDFVEIRGRIFDATVSMPRPDLFYFFAKKLKEAISKSLPELVEQFEELNTNYQEALDVALDQLERAKDELP